MGRASVVVPLLALVVVCGVLSVGATSTFRAVSVHLPEGAHRSTGHARGLEVMEWDGDASAPWAPTELARAAYNDSITTEGWGYLSVYTNPNTTLDDHTKAFAAGQAEGNLTAMRIWQCGMNNGIQGVAQLNAATQQFITTHKQWVSQMQQDARQLPAGSLERAYWWQTELIDQQFQGLYAGYKAAAASGENSLTEFEVELLTTSATVSQVNGLLSEEHKRTKWDMAARRDLYLRTASKCSALLKLAPGNKDFFMSQVTWSSFNSMLRTYKMYDFPFTMDGTSSTTVPGRRSAFSSYPGVLNSGDDFYALSSGLIVQETTIGNSNPELWTLWLSPLTVFESIRNIVANRLATTAGSWGDLFALYNSGTYNNQFMVFNMNSFVPGQPVPAGTFYVMEQIPGHTRNDDQTALLNEQGYYGSYNIAFYPDIAELSGINQLAEEFGSWFTYNMTARAQIFRRNQVNVETLADMQTIMRYNNFKVDPLSTQLNTCQYMKWTNCTPPYTSENTIATRGDLNDPHGVYSLPNFALRDHAATDAKIVSFSTFNNFSLPAMVISGPTYDQQPVFAFSTSPFANDTRLGIPDRWQMPWVMTKWT